MRVVRFLLDAAVSRRVPKSRLTGLLMLLLRRACLLNGAKVRGAREVRDSGGLDRLPRPWLRRPGPRRSRRSAQPSAAGGRRAVRQREQRGRRHASSDVRPCCRDALARPTSERSASDINPPLRRPSYQGFLKRLSIGPAVTLHAPLAAPPRRYLGGPGRHVPARPPCVGTRRRRRRYDRRAARAEEARPKISPSRQWPSPVDGAGTALRSCSKGRRGTSAEAE